MSALLSSWAEEKEYKTGHNEKKELKSILTNTIRGYILYIVRYGMGVYERGTVFNRVRQVPCRVARNNKQWVGTCLYQEWYKPLLISCEAAIRL